MVGDGKYATVIKVGDFNAGALTQDYLVIHHQAHLNQVPSRRSFVEANMVLLRKQIGASCKEFVSLSPGVKTPGDNECNLMPACLLSPRPTVINKKIFITFICLRC